MTYSKLSARQPFWSISMGFQSPASGCPSSRNVVANTSRNLSPVTKNFRFQTYLFRLVYEFSGLHYFCFMFFHFRVSQSHNYQTYTVIAGTLGNRSNRRKIPETLKTKPVRLNSILTSPHKHIIHRTDDHQTTYVNISCCREWTY